MATSRRATAIEIYQDPPHDLQRVEADLLAAFGNSVDVSAGLHTALTPTTSRPSALSPLKTGGRSSSPAAEVFRDANLNTVRFPRPNHMDFSTDSPQKKFLQTTHHISNPQTILFAPYHPTANPMNKENIYGPPTYPMKHTPVQGNSSSQKKRKQSTAEANPAFELANKKARPATPTSEASLPVMEDDGSKPTHSYATLIAMAILRAPNRRLTLNQIYNWIKTTFKYYQQTESKQGWQNSIRHNLSLNKAFTKRERPKDDPGKGSYWVIVPGMEQQFLKEKPPRRNTQSEGSSFPNMSSDAIRPPTATLPSNTSFGFPSSTVKTIDSAKLPDEAEFSSDATVLASDPAGAHEGQDADGDALPLPSTQDIRSSPPPVPEMHSSPPQAIMEPPRRKATPQPDIPTISHSQFTRSDGGRKRKISALGDSGYYSSIESSVTRNNPHGPLLTSEADLERSRHKRSRIGDRAEDEIARIRGSSYDSPTKGRVFMKPSTTNALPSSSPFRPFEGSRQAPLTPAVIFKRPARPPPSVSPNTNLRNHRNRVREMLGGSPEKTMSILRDNSLYLEDSPFSSTFLLPNESFNLAEDSFFSNYDVFSDLANLHNTPAARGSPEKKRPGLTRANTTSGILQDVTGVKANLGDSLGHKLPNLDFKKPYLRSPLRLGSPIKGSQAELPSQDKSPALDELFGMNIPSDDAEEEGFDILQNFGRIGARMAMPPPPARGNAANKENRLYNQSPTKQPGNKRPAFARSTTSIF